MPNIFIRNCSPSPIDCFVSKTAGIIGQEEWFKLEAKTGKSCLRSGESEVVRIRATPATGGAMEQREVRVKVGTLVRFYGLDRIEHDDDTAGPVSIVVLSPTEADAAAKQPTAQAKLQPRNDVYAIQTPHIAVQNCSSSPVECFISTYTGKGSDSWYTVQPGATEDWGRNWGWELVVFRTPGHEGRQGVYVQTGKYVRFHSLDRVEYDA